MSKNKGWRDGDFETSQREMAVELNTSQQNINDTICRGLRKAKELYLNYYTLEEIRSYIRHCERR